MAIINVADYQAAFGIPNGDSILPFVESAIPAVSDQVELYLDQTFEAEREGIEWVPSMNPGLPQYFPLKVPITAVLQSAFPAEAISVANETGKDAWICVTDDQEGISVSISPGTVTQIAFSTANTLQGVLDALVSLGFVCTMQLGVDPSTKSDVLYPNTLALKDGDTSVLLGAVIPVSVNVLEGTRVVIGGSFVDFPVSPVWLGNPQLADVPTLGTIFLRTKYGQRTTPPSLTRIVCEMVRDSVAIAQGTLDTNFQSESLSKYSYRLADGIFLGNLLSKYASALGAFKNVCI